MGKEGIVCLGERSFGATELPHGRSDLGRRLCRRILQWVERCKERHQESMKLYPQGMVWGLADSWCLVKMWKMNIGWSITSQLLIIIGNIFWGGCDRYFTCLISFNPKSNSMRQVPLFISFGHAHSMQKFLGQGLNLRQSSDLSCCSDNARPLARCATRELWQVLLLFPL